MCFIGKKIRAKSSRDGNLENGWLKVEIIAIKGPMAVINTAIFQANKQMKETSRCCESGSMAFLRRTNRCLGNVFRKISFERHS